MNILKNLFYTKEHEWANVKDNETVIGITDFAQGQLGDVIFIDFPEIGASFERGDIFGEIEAVKIVSELYAPLSGEIKEVNSKLEKSPELINADPYGEGWLIKIIPNIPNEKDFLMDALSYQELVEK